jgi:hypothetical protein
MGGILESTFTSAAEVECVDGNWSAEADEDFFSLRHEIFLLTAFLIL